MVSEALDEAASTNIDHTHNIGKITAARGGITFIPPVSPTYTDDQLIEYVGQVCEEYVRIADLDEPYNELSIEDIRNRALTILPNEFSLRTMIRAKLQWGNWVVGVGDSLEIGTSEGVIVYRGSIPAIHLDTGDTLTITTTFNTSTSAFTDSSTAYLQPMVVPLVQDIAVAQPVYLSGGQIAYAPTDQLCVYDENGNELRVERLQYGSHSLHHFLGHFRIAPFSYPIHYQHPTPDESSRQLTLTAAELGLEV